MVVFSKFLFSHNCKSYTHISAGTSDFIIDFAVIVTFCFLVFVTITGAACGGISTQAMSEHFNLEQGQPGLNLIWIYLKKKSSV